MLRCASSQSGEKRLVDLALVGAFVREEQILGKLLSDGRAALHDAARPGVGHERAEGAQKVDAEMLVETPILGRQHSLDEMIGHFIERHRIVVLDAAAADLVAVAVEKGDSEIGLLQPIVVGSLPEGGYRQRQHEYEPAGAQRRRLRQRFDENPAAPAGDMGAVHERGEPLVEFARPFAALEYSGIDARIEIKQ